MPSYRFALEEDKEWLGYLRERGYVVISNALSREETETAKKHLLRDIEAAHVSLSGELKNIPLHGIVPSLAQTAGAWSIRGNENIQIVFSVIWDTRDLITSMDAVILWPGRYRPMTEGLHLDQNPCTKPDFDCIQGMVPLLPVTKEVGGLEVVPFSHTPEAKEKQKEKHPQWKRGGDFCLMHNEEDYNNTRLLLECEPGDLILWDARLVHGGRVGTGNFDKDGLVRMSVPVAMTPRAWASSNVQERRKEGFFQGRSFNHCPHEAGTSTGTFHAQRRKGYYSFELTDSQKAVL